MTLDGTSWTITHIGDDAVIEGSEPTIAFEEGRAAGTTGCNRWFAACQIDEASISLGPAGSTMMMCVDDGVMDQEQAFLRTLELIKSFEATDGALTLSGSAGTVLLQAQSS